MIDLDGQWGWSKVDAPALQLIHEKVRHFETMTAGELFGPNVGHKHIDTDGLPTDASRRLQNIGLDDVDGLCELRLGGKQQQPGPTVGVDEQPADKLGLPLCRTAL